MIDSGFKKVAKRGNWYEEVYLEQTTGIKYYPDPKDRSKQLLTQDRTIGRFGNNDAKHYSSTTRSQFIDPCSTVEYKVSQQSDMGPREKLTLNKLKKEVEDNYKAKLIHDNTENRRVKYVSANSEAYDKPGFKPALRVNNTTGTIPTNATDYATDTAVTFYYDRIMNNQGKSLSFPISFITSANPFRKNTSFSSKPWIDLYARKCETNERPNRFPTFVEFKVFNVFRNRLIKHVQSKLTEQGKYNKGLAVGAILSYLYSGADSIESELLPIEYLDEILQKYIGFEINQSEKTSLLAAFDDDTSNRVNLAEFIKVLRTAMSPRRIEIIDIVYTELVNRTSDGKITQGTIVTNFKESKAVGDINSLLAALGVRDSVQEVTREDLFDYYKNVSSECDANDEFEAYIKGSWKFL